MISVNNKISYTSKSYGFWDTDTYFIGIDFIHRSNLLSTEESYTRDYTGRGTGRGTGSYIKTSSASTPSCSKIRSGYGIG